MVVLAGAFALTSCGWFGSDGGSTSTPPAATSLAAMLQWVPDTPVNRGHPVFYANLERLRGGTSGKDGSSDLALLLDRSSGAVFMPTAVRTGITDPGFAAAAGFDSRALHTVMEIGAEPDETAVLVGDFDAATVETGLRSAPGGDQLVVADQGTFTRLQLGNQVDLAAVSPVRPTGEPLVAALGEGAMVWSRATAGVDPVVQAKQGGATTLATDPQYSAVAAALDTKGIVNGVLLTGEESWGWEIGGMGESFGGQGKGSTLTVVLAYHTDTEAAAAVDAFRAHVERDESTSTGTPWSDTLNVTDVTSNGRLLVATLTSRDAGVALSNVLRRDNLLVFSTT